MSSDVEMSSHANYSQGQYETSIPVQLLSGRKNASFRNVWTPLETSSPFKRRRLMRMFHRQSLYET